MVRASVGELEMIGLVAWRGLVRGEMGCGAMACDLAEAFLGRGYWRRCMVLAIGRIL